MGKQLYNSLKSGRLALKNKIVYIFLFCGDKKKFGN